MDDTVYAAQSVGVVNVDSTVNGRVEVKKNTGVPTATDLSTGIAFSATPLTGYKLDTGTGTDLIDAMTAVVTYTDPSTVTNMQVTATITSYGVNNYVITASISNLASMTNVKVALTVKFTADLHTILATPTDGGMITIADSAKTEDEVEITAVASDGNKVASVSASTTDGTNVAVTQRDGKWYFTMPGADVKVAVTFAEKGFAVIADAAAEAYLNISETRADVGETVTVTASGTATNAGKKITSVTVQMRDDANNLISSVTVTVSGSDFVIPATAAGKVGKFVVSAVLADKAAAVTAATSTDGTIATASRTDSGDTLNITVTPTTGKAVAAVKLTITVGTKTDIVTATKNTDGTYSVLVPTLASGANVQVSATYGTATTTSTATKTSSSVSAGVGVAVAVVVHENAATIQNATIMAKNLTLTAKSGSSEDPITSAATAKAGYSAGSIGLGGAVAVHVASAKTKALIYNTANITMSGALTLAAASYERFTTEADASGSEKATTAGVGAGIAIAVHGVDAIAGIQDGTLIQAAADKIESIDISAIHDLSEAVSAKAGSAGGVSVTPVLALLISGADVEAYLGTNANANILGVTGDVKIAAESQMDRAMAANASAAGGSVGIGGSFAISVLNDSAKAYLCRSILAKNVGVASKAKSAVKATSRASANGASKTNSSSSTATASDSDAEGDGGQADAQADKSITGGGKLSGKVGSNNVNNNAVVNNNTGRQKGQTSEGGIQVAAGFVLNIMTNASEAYIAGGASVTATGTDVINDDGTVTKNGSVTVESKNLTTADIFANASATQSKVGVGVAVAINIVNYTNFAYVADAAIHANHLTVQALIIESASSNKKEEETKATDTNLIEDLVRSLMDEMLEAMGVKDLLPEEAITRIVDAVANAAGNAMEALLAGTGLEGLIASDVIETMKTNIEAFKNKLLSIPETIISGIETIVDFVEKLSDDPQSTVTEILNNLKSQALTMVQEDLAGLDWGSFFQNSVVESIKTAITANGAGVTLGAISTSVKDTILTGLTDLAKQLLEKVKTRAFTAIADATGINLQSITDLIASNSNLQSVASGTTLGSDGNLYASNGDLIASDTNVSTDGNLVSATSTGTSLAQMVAANGRGRRVREDQIRPHGPCHEYDIAPDGQRHRHRGVHQPDQIGFHRHYDYPEYQDGYQRGGEGTDQRRAGRAELLSEFDAYRRG